ncbi:Mur ligase domain-containing protein, partial [Bacteroidota bacterium]
MNINGIKYVYLIGAGGIGISALGRYFNQKGAKIYGYDRAKGKLCDELINEGIDIHFEDS